MAEKLSYKQVELYLKLLEGGDVGGRAAVYEIGVELEKSTGMRMFDIGREVARMALDLESERNELREMHLGATEMLGRTRNAWSALKAHIGNDVIPGGSFEALIKNMDASFIPGAGSNGVQPPSAATPEQGVQLSRPGPDSATPLTDAAERVVLGGGLCIGHVRSCFARSLERQLVDANALVSSLMGQRDEARAALKLATGS